MLRIPIVIVPQIVAEMNAETFHAVMDLPKDRSTANMHKERSWAPRREVALALGKLREPRAVEPLIKLLKSYNPYLRKAAVEALSEIGDPRAVGPLITCLQDRNRWVRDKAIQALGRIHTPEALEALAGQLAISRSEKESHTTALVLLTMAEIPDPILFHTLVEYLEIDDAFVRATTAKALGKWGDPSAIPLLKSCLQD